GEGVFREAVHGRQRRVEPAEDLVRREAALPLRLDLTLRLLDQVVRIPGLPGVAGAPGGELEGREILPAGGADRGFSRLLGGAGREQLRVPLQGDFEELVERPLGREHLEGGGQDDVAFVLDAEGLEEPELLVLRGRTRLDQRDPGAAVLDLGPLGLDLDGGPDLDPCTGELEVLLRAGELLFGELDGVLGAQHGQVAPRHLGRQLEVRRLRPRLHRPPVRTLLPELEERRPAQPVAETERVARAVIGRRAREPQVRAGEDPQPRRALALVAQREAARGRRQERTIRLPHLPLRLNLVVLLHEIVRIVPPRERHRLLERQRRLPLLGHEPRRRRREQEDAQGGKLPPDPDDPSRHGPTPSTRCFSTTGRGRRAAFANWPGKPGSDRRTRHAPRRRTGEGAYQFWKSDNRLVERYLRRV